ncbi:MAG: response regulator transcription factor [Laribacter sp.]|nr:response regulator transcription factor [Laribacter sp.]MBP9610117.1 response regulator transcription factor [Laribacter sp.]
MDALTAVIVDDDTLARDRLGQLLNDAGVRVLASLPDGLAALAWFRTPGHEADAAFVDIQMPQMDGLTLAQSLAGLPHPPAIVFCTTDEQHAVRAFDVHATDFLLKPVRPERLADALGRIAPVAGPANPNPPAHFTVTERGRVKLIPVESALFLKAELKYVTLRTQDGEHLLDVPLTQLEHEYGPLVVRVHRNCLVMRHAIAGFERNTEGVWHVMLNGSPERVAVSRRQQHVVKDFR